MSVRYNDDFKEEVVRAYMEGSRSTAQIAADYNIAKSTVTEWARKYREECQYTYTAKDNIAEEDYVKKIRRLNQLVKEKGKEIDFLKKAAAFFAKEIDQRYIDL